MHAAFEKVGIIEDWARENDHVLMGTHPYEGEKIPSFDKFDLLIVMGGPQSPRENDKYPYLEDEISLIRQSIRADKKVIGFCLGAQLIGEALGATTLKSPEKEVGVYPITLTPEGRQDPIFYDFPSNFDVIHWHNDMPGLTEDTTLLASSPGCPHQAFRYKENVYGFQFHMEITQDLAWDMIKHCPNDLQPSVYTQTAEEFLKADFDAINKKMKQILTSITS